MSTRGRPPAVRLGLRLLFAVVVLLSAAALASAYAGSLDDGGADEFVRQADLSTEDRDPVVEPRDGVTVVTTDSNAWLGEQGEGPRAKAELVAFAPNGTVLYYDDSHDVYWDSSPEPDERDTVLYTASDHLTGDQCDAAKRCTRNVVETVNLTTGEVTRLYERITPRKHATRWHDVDRVDGDRLLIADIYQDRVFIVDTGTEVIEWEWDAQTDYSIDTGGPFPDDWTHLNDVEYLDDGRIMVSLRNQHSVVFIDPEDGLQEDWTLGATDDRETLYQQHNPQYIPEEQGGPALLVADSENNRVVEYQRADGEWVQSWEWSDRRMQWPRDADRLPSGNTLIADSNSNRVIEVNPEGEIVWAVEIGFPYEAERLSADGTKPIGPSAEQADLVSRTVGDSPGESGADSPGVWSTIRSEAPSRHLNAVMWLTPEWMNIAEVVALVLLVLGTLVWVGLELYWSSIGVDVRSPIAITRERKRE